MFRTRERSQALRKALKEHFLFGLMARGYVKVRHTSLFYNYMSVKKGNVIGIEIQYDKYHRPNFIIHFKFVPLVAGKNGEPGFKQLYGAEKGTWHPAKEIINYLNGTYTGTLHCGPTFWIHNAWFSYSLYQYYTNKNACEDVMKRCLEAVASLEKEIETGEIQLKYRLDESNFMQNISLDCLDFDAYLKRQKLLRERSKKS